MKQLDIKFTVIARVDDELVYKGEFPDTAVLVEELYKAEKAVERKIDELEDEDE